MKIKALTIKQPWAWAIAAGHKDIENRSWGTDYRGPLAIHAGKEWDTESIPIVQSVLEDLGVIKPGERVGDRHLLATGAVVAVVDLADVCTDLRCRCSVWARLGQKHWRMRDHRALEVPVPASGRQGLWEINLSGPAVSS